MKFLDKLTKKSKSDFFYIFGRMGCGGGGAGGKRMF